MTGADGLFDMGECVRKAFSFVWINIVKGLQIVNSDILDSALLKD